MSLPNPGFRGEVAGLLFLFLLGCHLPQTVRPEVVTAERPKPKPVPALVDAVGLEVALLEGPVGDRYFNDVLWVSADEQVVALERKSELDDNGLRVGVIGGILPVGLQEMLTSSRFNPDPHGIRLRVGNTRPVALGGVRGLMQFQVKQEGKSTTVAYEQAQFALQVTPTLTAEGLVELACVPMVQQGGKPLWTMETNEAAVPLPVQRAAEKFPLVGWEARLAPGTYLLVGTRFDRAGTLGHACFVAGEGPRPVQRLLAIRASALKNPESSPEGSDAAGIAAPRGLAETTRLSAARGLRE